MNGLSFRFVGLTLLTLTCFALFGQSHAWERPPIKFKTEFKFHVEMKVGPEIKRPTAPWYAYFPNDPRMIPSPQTSLYPTWPQQFPPTSPPIDAKDLKKVAAEYMTPYWPGASYGYPVLQPVGFVPSYWYPAR